MTSAKIITVPFGSDTLFAIERDDGIFVAIKPIADTLGLKWSGQHDRLNRDSVLREGIRVIRIPTVGGAQDTACLKIELVNGWLFGIDDSLVRGDDLRERVLAYKRECYAALFNHFYGRSADERRKDFDGASAGLINEDQPILTKQSLVTEARQTHGTQAARELWFKLGLPTTPAMYADARQGEFFYTAIRRDPDRADRQAG